MRKDTEGKLCREGRGVEEKVEAHTVVVCTCMTAPQMCQRLTNDPTTGTTSGRRQRKQHPGLNLGPTTTSLQ